MFEKYYYNAKEKKCASFFWGGCEGVVPFETVGECEKTCLPPETLRITKLQTLDDIYVEVSLEFPKAWEKPDFQVQVDGKDVNANNYSGGFTEDRRTADLFFFPGRPGVKQISVSTTIGGETIRANDTFTWSGHPFAVLLGYPGDRLLVTAPEKVRVVAANMDEVTISVNGERTNPEIFGQDARLFSFVPAWRPGLNTVSVEGKGANGNGVRKSYTFIYPRDGIRQGEAALLDFGAVGTRSGPFFSVSIEGDAIAAGASRMADSYVLDGQGWVGRETRLVRELKAVKPGQARVLIFEKPHFLEEKRLIREIPIRVTPAA